MAKPKSEVEEKEYFKDIHFLYEALNSLKSLGEVKDFFKDVLTTTELRMLKRRWHIAGLLLQGLDVRTVAYESKTSTQTVSKIKKVLEEGRGGLRLAIERMNKTLIKEGRSNIGRNKQGFSSNKQGSKFVKGLFNK